MFHANLLEADKVLLNRVPVTAFEENEYILKYSLALMHPHYSDRMGRRKRWEIQIFTFLGKKETKRIYPLKKKTPPHQKNKNYYFN